MRPLKPEPLRLRAEAAADYDVISACLQDALMPLSEMAYLAEEKRFVAVFKWWWNFLDRMRRLGFNSGTECCLHGRHVVRISTWNVLRRP